MSSRLKQNCRDILCFGGEDWWYHNRGHIDMQLMKRFCRIGIALYINSIVMQKPNLKEGKKFKQKLIRKTKSIFQGLKWVDENFWIYSPLSLPVHHIHWLKPINEIILLKQLHLVIRRLGIYNPIVWVACPAACNIALKIKRVKLVYQRTDRFEAYPNVDAALIKKYDRKLRAEADLTVFVNNALYEQESCHSQKAIYLDHGVDYELFAKAENNKETPVDMRGIRKPIVGFFGGIDEHTCDIELLEKVIDKIPEMSFVLVGRPSVNCNGLMLKKNVWILGQKPYEQIPHYGKCFDIAIMPWRQNQWIEACNPIKLKEYLALGKPIVSTPFAELKKYEDVVYTAKSPGEFAHCIEQALMEDNPDRTAIRRRKVQDYTWDSKAQLVLEELFGKDYNFQVTH
ncbi:MAG: glycosyltransferase [Planctomycetota bacterium]